MVEDVVGTVRDRVVRPLVIAARGAVFGLLIATMAVLAGVLVAIAVIRLLDVYAFANRVWASDALVGFLWCMAGAYAWSHRSPRNTGRAGGSEGRV